MTLPQPDTRARLERLVGPAIAAAASDEDLLQFEQRSTTAAQPTGVPRAVTTYEPTAKQLEGVDPNREKVQALAVQIDIKVAEGVDKLHDALKAEFGRPPFSVQAQSALARIERVVTQIRGRRA